MDWIVRLEGDENYLQELSKVLTRPELSIEKDKTLYFLKSTLFQPLTVGEDVRGKAYEIMLPINAGIILEMGAQRPIQIGFPIKIDPVGKKRVLLTFSGKIVYNNNRNNETIAPDGKKQIRNPEELIVSLYSLAQNDLQVAKVCQYLNLDLNSWFTLYNILEILQEDNFKPLMRGGHHKEKADNFTETADNFRALGVKSRHAKELTKKKKRIEPPKNPVSLSKAQEFIEMLIREWLDEKRKKKERFS